MDNRSVWQENYCSRPNVLKLSLNGRRGGLPLSLSPLEFVDWVKRCAAFTFKINTSVGHHTSGFNHDTWNHKVLRLSQGSKDWGDFTILTDWANPSHYSKYQTSLLLSLCAFVSLSFFPSLLIFSFMLIKFHVISQKLSSATLDEVQRSDVTVVLVEL